MRVLITGGCGFTGCNMTKRFCELGHQVVAIDDLSRRGSRNNLDWLRDSVKFDFVQLDVRDAVRISDLIGAGNFDVVVHLAGQVAVTTSVANPRLDFEINARGTFNVLEAIRLHSPRTILLNASTNKVYGKLADLSVRENNGRYELVDLAHGVNESQPLDLHSPYGCSKGAADQYVTDFARIYGLRTVNFRQSCIYGPRQFGVEDQGWVAWFIIAHLLRKPVTIYGDGKQVRDILFIDDLIDCYVQAINRIDSVAGRVFNIGGGARNTLSLLELLDTLEKLSRRKVQHSFAEWRPGDQPVYVSDIRKANDQLRWSPTVGVGTGVQRLYDWVQENLAVLSQLRPVTD
jgi:CDP-paratose 2-epimerase